MWEVGVGKAEESNGGIMGTIVIEQKLQKGKKEKKMSQWVPRLLEPSWHRIRPFQASPPREAAAAVLSLHDHTQCVPPGQSGNPETALQAWVWKVPRLPGPGGAVAAAAAGAGRACHPAETLQLPQTAGAAQPGAVQAGTGAERPLRAPGHGPDGGEASAAAALATTWKGHLWPQWGCISFRESYRIM